MDESFKYNVDAFLAYSNTDRFRDNWDSENNIEYIAQRSQLFLDAFNILMNNIEDKDKDSINIKYIIKATTRKETFEMYLKEGMVKALQSVARSLNLKNQNIKQSSMPIFKITRDEYIYFFEKAKEYYYRSSYFHQLRLNKGVQHADEGLEFYLELRGEVFNQTLAKEYVAKESFNLTDKELYDFFKMTKTGKKCFLAKNKM